MGLRGSQTLVPCCGQAGSRGGAGGAHMVVFRFFCVCLRCGRLNCYNFPSVPVPRPRRRRRRGASTRDARAPVRARRGSLSRARSKTSRVTR